MVFLNTTSHRSRERLERMLGHHPQYYFVMGVYSGSLVPVLPEQVEAARHIPGVTVARLRGAVPSKCWDMGHEGVYDAGREL
jgi:hypothetical protein